jgi:eukaryotic-like serine/threonine-protein kinase
MIGTIVSHYRILEKLGEGGMGIVYKAEDNRLKRTIALKFLPPHTLSSEEERERFTREAQAAASLNHPNIATVFAIDEHDGGRFIAMEYIRGENLSQKLRSGPMKIPDALDIAIQIAEGLHAAHENGILHRDMKSANVMVTDKGQVKIMDFGLAKLKGVSLLTRQGSTLGTVSYMSPEQARGEKVDRRTDIWSLGVVLYEMLTGRLPFAGEFEQSIIYGIINSEPEPVTSVRSNVPMELDRILAKLMAKDPADRYQSAQEIPVDLRAVKAALKGSSPGTSRIAVPVETPRTVFRKSTNKLPWLLALFLAAVSGVTTWGPWRSHDTNPLVGRFEVVLPKGDLLDIVVYSSVAISPDGFRIVYRANGRLYLRNLDQFDPVALPGTEEAGTPFFSPDGNWVGFFSGGKLKKISVNGGSPIELADALDNRGASWGADGTIAYSPITTTGIWLIPAAGGEPRRLTIPDSAKQERTHRSPSFLPDGKTVLFTVGVFDSPDYYEEATIEAVNVETGKRKVVMKGASTATYVATGHLVHSRGGVLYASAFDTDRLDVIGSPIPVLEGVDGDPTSGAVHYAISGNGTLAYIAGDVAGGPRSLSVIDLTGKSRELPGPDQMYSEPRVSPDSKRVAVVLHSGKDSDVWIYDVARSTISRLTFGGTNRTPTWSPDGKRIAYFTSSPETNGKLHVRNTDGTGEARLLSQGLGRAYITSWSKDGSLLILDRSTTQGNQSDLWVLPLKDDAKPWPFLTSRYDEWQATLSPDGKWLSYMSNESGTYQVYVQPFPGRQGKWQISTEGGTEPRWSPDGKNLYYTNGQRMMVVPITTTRGFSAGKPRQLFDKYQALPVDSGISYDVLPDGSGFVTTLSRNAPGYQRIRVVLNWTKEVESKVDGTR